MILFARYTGLVLGVLVVAVVLALCGEGSCSSCLSACCARAERTRRPEGLLGRVLAACGCATVTSAEAGYVAESPTRAIRRVIAPATLSQLRI